MESILSKNSKAQNRIRKLRPQVDPKLSAATSVESGFGQPYRDSKARDDNNSFPLDGQDLFSISDQQLADLFFTAPKLHQYGVVDVVRLSKSVAVQGGEGVPLGESQNMIFAVESLHLPVPRVHRAFTADIPGFMEGEIVKGHFIVMDYVPGLLMSVGALWI